MLRTQLTRRKARTRVRCWKLAIRISHNPSTRRSTSYSISKMCWSIRLSCRQIRLFPFKKTLLNSRQHNSSKKVPSRQLTETSERLRHSIRGNLQTILPRRIIVIPLTWALEAIGTLQFSNQVQLAISLTHQLGRTTTKIKTQSWSKEASASRHQLNRMMSATQFNPDFSSFNLSKWPMSSTISCFNTWLRIPRRNNQARTTTRTLDAPGLKQRAAAP